MEQLGSGKTDIAIGGAYALQRIMRDSSTDRATVIKVLNAYVSTHTRSDKKTHKAVTSDVQTALEILGQRPDPTKPPYLDFNLTGQLLTNGIALPDWSINSDSSHTWEATHADLTGADLRGANLTGADLTDADLTQADLAGSDLTEANMVGVNLAAADLTDATLTAADLFSAYLSGADLTGANLTKTTRSGRNLTAANLTHADLTGADLAGADLSDTDLALAKLNSARWSAETIWPAGTAEAWSRRSVVDEFGIYHVRGSTGNPGVVQTP